MGMKNELGANFLQHYQSPIGMTLELFFTIIIIFSCILIYIKTREIYNLTEHKGIRYFRKGFLLIGFAHIIMTFQTLFRFDILTSWQYLDMNTIFFLFGILQIIGVTYLFSSMFSDKIKEYYIILFPIGLFLISLFLKSKLIMGLYGFLLISSLGIISFKKLRENKKKKKKFFSHIHTIYFIFFISWVIQVISRVIVDIEIRGGKLINVGITSMIFLYIAILVYEKLNLKNIKQK